MKMPRPVDAPRPSLRDVRPTLTRVGAGLAIALGFLWMTSRIDPGQTRASEAGAPVPAVTGARTTSAPGASMGTLVGRNVTINIIATPDGPRYTVLDPTGGVLAERLTEEELYDLYPELRMDTITAGPLMLAEPD